MAFTFGKKQGDMPPNFDMGGPSGYPPLSGMTPGAYPSGSPIDRVVQLKQQGMTNNQIVASLTRDGLSANQIFDAMNQVDMRNMMTPQGGQQMEGQNEMDQGMM